MTQRRTVGYIFAFCALGALVFLSWYLKAGFALFLAGIPAVFIAGFVGAAAHKLIVSRNLFVAALVGAMVSCISLLLVPLLIGAVLAFGNLDALGGGLVGSVTALWLFGIPVSVFGAASGLAAYLVAKKNQPYPPLNRTRADNARAG
jgi:hypothetical protein